MPRFISTLSTLLALLALAGSAAAAVHDRGGGLLYDDLMTAGRAWYARGGE